MELLIAGAVNDRCLEDEELCRDQHQKDQRDQYLPYGRLARRDKEIKRGEQQRVQAGEDGKGAWVC